MADQGTGKASKETSLHHEADLSDEELDGVVGGSGMSFSGLKKDIEHVVHVVDETIKPDPHGIDPKLFGETKHDPHGVDPKQLIDAMKHDPHGVDPKLIEAMKHDPHGVDPKQAFDDEHKHGKTGESPQQAIQDASEQLQKNMDPFANTLREIEDKIKPGRA